MATHSSTLAWRIPWTEEPGRLQSMGSQRVRHYWATKHICTHTQDERVMVDSSDKMGPLEKGMANHFLPWELHESMKRQKDRTLKDELTRSVGAQYATGEEWRNNSRKNEQMEPKQKQCPVVDVTGDGINVWSCKEQYCIGTWNVCPWIKANWKWSNRGWQEWLLF